MRTEQAEQAKAIFEQNGCNVMLQALKLNDLTIKLIDTILSTGYT